MTRVLALVITLAGCRSGCSCEIKSRTTTTADDDNDWLLNPANPLSPLAPTTSILDSSNPVSPLNPSFSSP